MPSGAGSCAAGFAAGFPAGGFPAGCPAGGGLAGALGSFASVVGEGYQSVAIPKRNSDTMSDPALNHQHDIRPIGRRTGYNKSHDIIECDLER